MKRLKLAKHVVVTWLCVTAMLCGPATALATNWACRPWMVNGKTGDPSATCHNTGSSCTGQCTDYTPGGGASLTCYDCIVVEYPSSCSPSPPATVSGTVRTANCVFSSSWWNPGGSCSCGTFGPPTSTSFPCSTSCS